MFFIASYADDFSIFDIKHHCTGIGTVMGTAAKRGFAGITIRHCCSSQETE
jgi:hypothetical protein